MLAFVSLAFGAISVRLVVLASSGQSDVEVAISEPLTGNYARPDIIDRNGRLLATDVEAPSLYADPALVIDRDELVESLATIFSDLNQDDLRNQLADRSRRFVWIRRGLSPAVAQRVHDLGLPGLEFRRELKRTYPLGTLAGHVLGAVNIDNRGLSGIERWIDDNRKSEPVQGTSFGDLAPVRLSLDIGVQHALESELEQAMKRYKSEGASGLVLDVNTGEFVAAASLPSIDPLRPLQMLEQQRKDKLAASTFELGSIFKTLTIAMALDYGLAKPGRMMDVSRPLQAGPFTIKDLHGSRGSLSVTGIFKHSSNVGAGMLALEAGPQRLKEFLNRLGLLDTMTTEAGPVAQPMQPKHWLRSETITIAYGHGLAVAPLQFAVASAAVVNGGFKIEPTFIKRHAEGESDVVRVVNRQTSAALQRMMRQNVSDQDGTGKRADVAGYSIGGKTGTAEIAKAGGYHKKAVISSFLAIVPSESPQYLVLVSLFEPTGVDDSGGQITAGSNAAPVAGRLISRIAPALGLTPGTIGAAFPAGNRTAFDVNAAKTYDTP